MKNPILLFLFLCALILGCKESPPTEKPAKNELAGISTKDVEYRVLDSKVLDVDALWTPFNAALGDFSTEEYERVKALVFEKSIPEIQQARIDKRLTYVDLTLFYLFRIKKYDRLNDKSLNAVIALNPDVLAEAKKWDNIDMKIDKYSLMGLPILLKDNINASGMPTTAGAIVFAENNTEDAFITERLKSNGAIILGKANLSEWAYFFCGNCPSGYSAVGGQTLNPYGRKVHDTGGSSSGSGVSMAASFAVAAVGTETSGSILSPSSANSVVGLKPTIGLLSRSGIVPISSTLDTPGPMTRNVMDNAIMLEAMRGYDSADAASMQPEGKRKPYYLELDKSPKELLMGKRLGYFKNYMEDDSLYVQAIETLKASGATLVEIEREDIDLPGFVRILNLDMQRDLPEYIEKFGNRDLKEKDLEAIMAYNGQDSALRMPYGQKLFRGIVADSATEKEFTHLKDTLGGNGRRFFDLPMQENKLDAVLSINNYMASFAAVAKYPALTVPMGYKENNRPMGLTFIAPSGSEHVLLQLAHAYEAISKERKVPEGYE